MRDEEWRQYEGRKIRRFTLHNHHGMEATIASYGATLTRLILPDSNGQLANVVLGYDRLSDYVGSRAYLGATIGRYANRIAKGCFALNGKSYDLPRNGDQSTLHGGYTGFDKKCWSVDATESTSGSESVLFSYFSPDGEEGFPGDLDVRVEYSLNDDCELRLSYWASCDADTVLNLTNHSYFNLAGSHSGPILDHLLFLNADHFLPVDAKLIPTGEIRSVDNSPFDFRIAKPVGRDIAAPNEQLRHCKGYDLNWITNRSSPDALELAACLSEPRSGRSMEVLTTQPGIQFYSGNQLEGASSAGAFQYPIHAGLCLETQHFPDSPNNPHFPAVILPAGAVFRSSTVLRFAW